MNPMIQRIERATADLPEYERDTLVADLVAQAEAYQQAWLDEEKARAAHTMIGLEEALRGEGMTIEQTREHMEQHLASLRK